MKNIKNNSIKLAKNYFANAYTNTNIKTNIITTDKVNLTSYINPNTNSQITNNKSTNIIGLQLLNNLSKSTDKWPGLMFLQKKGKSQTKPNFNYINYSFPFGVYINENEELVTPIYNANKLLMNNIYKFLVLYFKTMYCLISKPIFIFTQDTVKIQLFYFACVTEHLSFKTRKGIDLISDSREKGIDKISLYYDIFSNLTKVYPQRFKIMCSILSNFFEKPVELELIRLHKPYLDSNILINFLSLIINRRDLSKSINKVFKIRSMNTRIKTSNSSSNKITNLLTLINNLKGLLQIDNNKLNTQILSNNLTNNSNNSNNNNTSNLEISTIDLVNNWFGLSKNKDYNNISEAYLTGINIKISGRLRREPIIPKVTTKKFEKGFTAKGKINYAQMARFTHKNRKGAFSITIKSGQNF